MGFLFKVVALIAIGALSTKKGRDFVQNILQICWPTVFPPTEKDGKTIDADVESDSNGAHDKKSKKKEESKKKDESKDHEEEPVNSNS